MHTTTALQAFVAHMVDYAGIFPPSQLPLDEAVQHFAEYRRGEDAPMLGRMIVPATRLHEVDRAGELTVVPPYPFSVIGRGGTSGAEFLVGLREDLAEVVRFRRRLSGYVAVDCLEARLPLSHVERPQAETFCEFADEVARIIDGEAPEALQPFFEVPLDEGYTDTLVELVKGLAKHRSRHLSPGPHSHGTYVGAGIKLRCGGTAPPPNSEQVAQAIEACRDANVPLKFTAGLHHAVRDPRRPGYPHGFVNLFAAGLLSTANPGMFDRRRLLDLIDDENADHFSFDNLGMEWNGARASVDQIREGRRLFTSFGSCSFDDPRSDLRALNWLALAR